MDPAAQEAQVDQEVQAHLDSDGQVAHVNLEVQVDPEAQDVQVDL